MLQLPQWLLSVFSSKQLLLQLEYPELQLMPQLPPLQVGCPFGVEGHWWPQLLQFAMSVCSLTHVLLQSDSPEGHALVHAYAEEASAVLHTGPPASVPQAPPQVPQLLVVLSATHAPPSGLQTV